MKKNEEVGIRPKLWVQQMANGSYMKPKAPYVMINEEKDVFLQVIKKLKILTNYVSILKSRVQKDGKLKRLKSHDYHILMQKVIPLCLQKVLEEEVRMALINLSRVFFLNIVQRSLTQTLQKC